jgi:hypothetical protein
VIGRSQPLVEMKASSEYDQIETDSQVDLESVPDKSNTIHRILKKTNKSNNFEHICWFHLPSEPWSLSYYLSDGQENFHIYLWLLKDLSWVQSWYITGIVIGGIACSWSIFLISKSISQRNINEFWSRFADLLWLFANYWWMIGETHDYERPNERSIYEIRTRQAAAMMIASLVWIVSYYLILKPLKFTELNPLFVMSNNGEEQRETEKAKAKAEEEEGEDHEPVPRFSFYFKSWREYENLHSLFWIGKDTAWVLANTPMWFIFFFPTVAVSIDVTMTTLYKPKLLVDHAHHCAQLLWVFSNAVWASGELFLTTHHDEPLSLSRSLFLSLSPSLSLCLYLLTSLCLSLCLSVSDCLSLR